MNVKQAKLKLRVDDCTKFERRLIAVAVGLIVVTLLLSLGN